MLEKSRNASPFPLEGGRLGWGWKGGTIAKHLYIPPFYPHPSLPPARGKEKIGNT